ncbi:MAG: hypothetical protein IKP98_00655 [Bacilli bacterium]|nr:hypothetical protein [Bacilli bacterium]
MKILYTAFKGKNNSSKILLDNINSDNKLYLTNSFKTSELELQKELDKDYDLVISFGQAPLDSNTIKIETTAKGESEYITDYDYNDLYNKLKREYKVIISNNAGNYLCNSIYYYGLKYIKENNLKTKMIFIHIPKKFDIKKFLDTRGVDL